MTVPILTYHSWNADGLAYEGNDHTALYSDLQTINQLGLRIVSLGEVVDALLSDQLHKLSGCVGLSFDGGARLDAEDLTNTEGLTIKSFQRILIESTRSGFVHATSFVFASGAVSHPDKDNDSQAWNWSGVDWWSEATRSGVLKIENQGWDQHGANGGIHDHETARHQVRQASDRIDALLGSGHCQLFAYPAGKCSDYLVQEYFPRHYAEHRIRAAFLTRAAPVSMGDNRWMLPRYVCGRDWHGADQLRQLLREGKPVSHSTPTVTGKPEPVPPGHPVEASYQAAWNNKSEDDLTALAAVDGSGSEQVVQQTGQFSARQVQIALDIRPTDSVFELGCGVGRIGREIAPCCHYWAGADISENMLRVARQRLSDCSAVDFHHLTRSSLEGIETERFEKAYAVAVLCHLDKEDAFLYLQEMARILKPGGQVYFETWNLAHPVGWKRWEYEVRNWAHSKQIGRKDVARNQFSTPEEVRLMTEHAGFDVAACYFDSPWVQMVGVKSGPADETLRVRKYQEENADRIANTEEWSMLFSKQLDVVYGAIGPADLMDWYDTQPDTESLRLHRNYLLALWQRNQRRWGVAPAK